MRPLVHRCCRALLLLGAVTPLAACGADAAPIAAADAVTHYESVVDDLTGALADDGTSWQLAQDTRKIAEHEGACRFTPGTWQPAVPLPTPDGDGDWEDRIAAVNPVIADHGFAEIQDTTAQGSRTVLETRDDHGATLRITPEGEIRIWEVAVDAAPCTPESLGIG